MSSVAAIRNRSSIALMLMALGQVIGEAIVRGRKTRRDRRALQAMPGYLLADLGLEKLEFRSSADGRRDVWVIPHRYY